MASNASFDTWLYKSSLEFSSLDRSTKLKLPRFHFGNSDVFSWSRPMSEPSTRKLSPHLVMVYVSEGVIFFTIRPKRKELNSHFRLTRKLGMLRNVCLSSGLQRWNSNFSAVLWLSKSFLAIDLFSVMTASSRGVHPAVLDRVLFMPNSKSKSTTSSCWRRTATCRHVFPCASFAMRSFQVASSQAFRSPAMSPLYAALCKG
mmetsp:Transcript_5536/g.20176  ORF Transcript_5536/g.20176 Transcript_5536/m.20176 type:complete len:202 (-) Transcript_5536:148-753(-)